MKNEKSKYFIYLGIGILVLFTTLSLVFASNILNVFTADLEEEELEFGDGGGTITRYLDVYLDATVSTAIMNITGIDKTVEIAINNETKSIPNYNSNNTLFSSNSEVTDISVKTNIDLSSSVFYYGHPALNNHSFYTPSDDTLYQLNMSNISQIINQYSLNSNIDSDIILYDNYVYVGDNKTLFQLNASNISILINSNNLGSNVYGITTENNFIYVVTPNNLFQLNATNISIEIANVSEKHTDNNIFITLPTITKDYLYFGNSSIYHRRNSTNISQSFENRSGVLTQTSLFGDYIYFPTESGVLKLNSTNLSQVIDSNNEETDHVGVDGDYIYYYKEDSSLFHKMNISNISQLIDSFVLDFIEGEKIRKGSFVLTENYVYLGSIENNLYQLNISNFNEISKINDLGFQYYTEPVLGNGYIYGQSRDGEIIRYGNGTTLKSFFPQNVSLRHTTGSTWFEHKGILNTENQTENFASTLNGYLTNFGGCSQPSGTQVVGNNCRMEFKFRTDSEGIVKYSDIQIVWTEPNIPNNTINNVTQVPDTFTFNFSVTVVDDYNLDTCWYAVTNNTGGIKISNTTYTCNTDQTDISLSPAGNYTFYSYVNDTSDNLNQSTQNFTMVTPDTPQVTINSVTQEQIGINRFTFNATSTDNVALDTCWYNVFLSSTQIISNTTYTCNTNQQVNVTQTGLHTLNVYANDSGNRIGSDSADINVVEQEDQAGGGGGSQQAETTTITQTPSFSPEFEDVFTIIFTRFEDAEVGDSFDTEGEPAVDLEPLIVVGDNVTWSMETERGGSAYQLEMSQGGTRTKKLIFKNLGNNTVFITLSCEDIINGICIFTELSDTEFELPVGDTRTVKTFTIELPDDIEVGEKNIVMLAVDQEGNQGVLPVIVNVGLVGAFVELFLELFSLKGLFVFFLFLIFGIILFFTVFRRFKGGGAITILITTVGIFVVLFFI